MCYYQGYMVDCDIWDLTDSDRSILDAGILLVDNHWSIRQLAKNILTSKSKVHRDLHKIRSISYDLYGCIQRTLKENKR